MLDGPDTVNTVVGLMGGMLAVEGGGMATVGDRAAAVVGKHPFEVVGRDAEAYAWVGDDHTAAAWLRTLVAQ